MKSLKVICFLLTVLGTSNAFAFCGHSFCYDGCQKKYVRVAGNECERDGVWNSEKSCFEARGYCEENFNGFCHRSTYCYDYCYNKYILSTGDSCEEYYNREDSCWASMGVCTRYP
ncbi:MAG: hypothetical protein R3A80_08550 [Bdellovibrionota bacterium]